ncbi:hypothetical protein EMCRGX_G003867 [Ephydatia muelleri]
MVFVNCCYVDLCVELVPEDVAQLFVSFSAKLRENVNPDCISAYLYAHNLITSSEKAEIDLPTFTPLVRMDKLLAAVNMAIRIDPSNYEIFLEILGKEKKYSNLVKEMRGNTRMGRTNEHQN